MSISWEWVANTRLGPIVLGDNIDTYIHSLNAFLEDEGNDNTNWYRYRLPNYDICIDVENKKVVSVTSYSDFFYKEKNIIGMSIIELGSILGCTADEVGDSVLYDDSDRQTPYEYFDLGLQVWVSEQRVVSVSCLTYKNCDE